MRASRLRQAFCLLAFTISHGTHQIYIDIDDDAIADVFLMLLESQPAPHLPARQLMSFADCTADSYFSFCVITLMLFLITHLPASASRDI